MNTLVIALVLLVILQCIISTHGHLCTVGNIHLSVCELASWSAWDCSGCHGNIGIATKSRPLCCNASDDKYTCLSHCHDVQETDIDLSGPCAVYCAVTHPNHHTSISQYITPKSTGKAKPYSMKTSMSVPVATDLLIETTSLETTLTGASSTTRASSTTGASATSTRTSLKRATQRATISAEITSTGPTSAGTAHVQTIKMKEVTTEANTSIVPNSSSQYVITTYMTTKSEAAHEGKLMSQAGIHITTPETVEQMKEANVIQISLCEVLSASLFLLGLIIGATVVGLVCYILLKRQRNRLRIVSPKSV